MPASEAIVETGSARLWTARTGCGAPPVLLCNGGPGCCDYLAPIAAMIDDLQEVIRWESRGCGRSSPQGPFDLSTCISDLEDLRVALAIERWIVGGHSWGANLALAYALRHPQRCTGLIYLSGTGLSEEWKSAYRIARAARPERLPDF